MKWIEYSLLFCLCITIIGIGLMLLFLGQALASPLEAIAIGIRAMICGYVWIGLGIVELVFAVYVILQKRK